MIRIQGIFFFLLVSCVASFSYSQQLGEIKEVELILEDIPFSGDAKQVNFRSIESNQWFSFNDITWKDSTHSLYDFFHMYHEDCQQKQFQFKVKMVYLQQEVFEYKRYVGYVSTGKLENAWVLQEIKTL